MISRLVTERAPWRCAVPMQSAPVSPPPMTMTSLPAAVTWPVTLAEGDPVGRGQEVHGLHDAVELAPGNRQLARHGGADRHDDRVEPLAQVGAGEVAPTSTPVRKRVPSDFICPIRRSRTAFSILNSGMP